jgi:hypothetical protein
LGIAEAATSKALRSALGSTFFFFAGYLLLVDFENNVFLPSQDDFYVTRAAMEYLLKK